MDFDIADDAFDGSFSALGGFGESEDGDRNIANDDIAAGFQAIGGGLRRNGTADTHRAALVYTRSMLAWASACVKRGVSWQTCHSHFRAWRLHGMKNMVSDMVNMFGKIFATLVMVKLSQNNADGRTQISTPFVAY